MALPIVFPKFGFLSEADKHVGVVQSLCAKNSQGLSSKPGILDSLLWVIKGSLSTYQLLKTNLQ